MSSNLNTVMDEDQDLVTRICQNNRQALEALYQKYVDKMLGLSIHILGNKDDAQEVIHDVIIEIWHKAHAYNPKRASVLGWILLRVRSRSLDRLRKYETMSKYLKKQVQDDVLDQDDMSEKYIQSKFIKNTLELLSNKQRNVIELSYFKGLSCSEISQHYDIPLGTVKTRLLSAMNKMKAHMSAIDGGLR